LKIAHPIGLDRFFGFLLISGCLGANAAVYYVDAVAGSDGNGGADPGRPWKNCPGMSAYSGSGTLSAGDSVYFARSQVWQLSGAQGIYLTGGVTYIGNSWGTGSLAVIRAASDCDAGVVRFRDHPIQETVFQGFEVDANKTVSTGIDINHRYGSLMKGATKRVKDCVVHNIWSSTVLGQYKYGVIISNHGGTNAYCDNVEILDTVVHDTSRDAIGLYPGDENAGCRIKNITVQGCEAFNTGQDPGYGAGAGIGVKGYVQDAWIDHCYVHDTKGAAMFINGNESNHFPGIGPTNINICYNIFTCSNVNGAIRIYDGSSGKDPKDVKIYGNIVYHSTAGGGFYVDADLGNTNRICLYNNTFYNASVYINGLNAVFSVLEFKNNIFYYSGGIPLSDTRGQITSHANNIFYGTGTLVKSGANSYTASSLKSGYEGSASSSNPLFKNSGNLPTGLSGTLGVDLRPNYDGLSLQPGSYGVSNGTALVSPYNGSINSNPRPLGSGWDIGAYQSLAQTNAAGPLLLAQAKWLSAGVFVFQFNGQTGQSYTVQSSVDLVHWVLLTNFVGTSGPMTVIDAPASQGGAKFYRVLSP